jgi:hypothetical protein
MTNLLRNWCEGAHTDHSEVERRWYIVRGGQIVGEERGVSEEHAVARFRLLQADWQDVTAMERKEVGS